MEKEDQFKAVKFLRSLYRNCSEPGWVNIRILPEGKNLFVPLSEIDSIPQTLKEHKDQNAYFGVATRIKGDGTKDGILQIPALWVDIDFNGRPRKLVRERLNEFKLKPSVIIKTGGGFHAYWLLKKPASQDQIPKIESLNKRLAFTLDGDMGATDASRILRIPGTVNLKPGRNKYLVRPLTFKPERRYKIRDFDFLPPIRKEHGTCGTDASGWADKALSGGVSEGERHITLTKLAGRYFGKGLSWVEARTLLKRVNNKCSPPLDKEELHAILRGIHNKELKRLQAKKRGSYEPLGIADIYNFNDLNYVVKGLIAEESLSILGGYTGVGKSFVAYSIIKAVLTGEPLWGIFKIIRPGAVILIDEETPESILKDRLKKMGFTKKMPLSVLFRKGVMLDRKESFKKLMAVIREKDPALIVIDSLTRVHNQNENDSRAMKKVFRRLRKIADEGYPVLVIHHYNKGDKPVEGRLRGSTDIPGAIDMEYALTRKDGDMVFQSGKSRLPSIERIGLKIVEHENKIDIVPSGMAQQTAIMPHITKYLSRVKEGGIEEIHNALKEAGADIPDKKLRRILKQATGKQLKASKAPHGKYAYGLDPAFQFPPNINIGETGKTARRPC